MVYQRIPIDRNNGKCVVCGNPINTKKSIKIILRDRKSGEYDIIELSVRHCKCCDLPYLSSKEFSSVHSKTTPFYIDGCQIEKNCDLKKIRKRLFEVYNINKERKNETKKLEDDILVEYILLSINEEKIIKKVVKITSEKNDWDCSGKYHYSTLIARKLLSIDIVLDCDGTVEIGNIKYRIHNRFYNDKNDINKYIYKNYLRIKSGGGLFSHVESRNQEIVDVLLYSPYTKSYEIIKATYDCFEDELYTDICLYKRFYEEFGNPEIELYSPEAKIRRYDNFENAQSESLLKIFGYSVGQKDNLTDREREKILADVMDLKHIEQKRLLSFLNWVKSVHSSEKYCVAQNKWAHDISFVSNYKTNAERFLISNVKK